MNYTPQSAELNHPTLEERIERIEKLLDKVVALAKDHPMGQMLVKMLGL